jgi:hypothetical protein
MFYALGAQHARIRLGLEKSAGVAKNLLGAAKEGLGYLTPASKSTLTGTLAGGGAGAVGGALADTPGGAAGGALMGAGLGGGGGRLAQMLAKRFGKSHTAARAFGQEGGRSATRNELIELLQQQGTKTGAMGGLGRTLLRGGAGAAVGAGIGGMTDAGMGAGALAGAGGAMAAPGLARLAKEPLARMTEGLSAAKKSIIEGAAGRAAPEAAGAAGAAGRAAPEAAGAAGAAAAKPPMTVHEFIRGRPGAEMQSYGNELHSRLLEFMQNPQAWQQWAKEKGLDLATRA